jgi:uncharacterized membrane protein YbhN (UPF0104 family)
MPIGSLGDFFAAVDKFFSNLAAVSWGTLAIGLVFFTIYLTIRSRAYFHTLRAAYPGARIRWRDIWGAYVAAYGFNNVVPARGGDVMKLFLVRGAVPGSSYPAIGASYFVEAVFDGSMAIPIMIFGFTQGVFPKPSGFSKLKAFDLSFFASHPRFLLFTLTVLGVLSLVAFAWLSRRVALFWARVRQGLTILFDRARFLREVWAVLFVAWLFRCAAFWMLLEAFHVGGSVRNVLLVIATNVVGSIVPFTPGGAGVQQAFLVAIFGSQAAAFSVGQQIAISALSLGLGFFAIVAIFRFRSFKEVITAGRASRAAEAEPA